MGVSECTMVPAQAGNMFFLSSVCKLGLLCVTSKYAQQIVVETLESKEACGCHKSGWDLHGLVETPSGLV